MGKLARLLRHDWPLHLVLLATNWLPDNVVFLRLRGALARPFLGLCGPNLRLGRGISFYNPAQIEIGRDVYLAFGCVLLAEAPILVGDEVIMGPYCVLASSDHTLQGGSYRYGPSRAARVTIAQGSWLAAHVVVTAGSTVGAGTLVAAGAVVAGSVSDGVKAGGVPARVLRS